ncbi:zinc-ribbon domain-containing protein [Pseudarthrobacter sp. LT1]|uniref:zinc-ribbon domain-containing protein n=1 Tax=Pseudarthrobacter sp. LT1 TaxID=3111450 RepID=UPI002D798260|nr:zinc-ribbon domain-containing protein [Pseudarthrobacter sp. LT1]WRT15621.1 zinc-ribbon domain-containing protein [Pseudarthrobacter sp. LT1]
MASISPDLATEWDYEKNYPTKPSEVTTGRATKFWWLCEQGHSWQTTVHSRRGLGTGCPQCWSGWRRSLPEIALQYELDHVLPSPVVGDTEVRTSTGAWHVDVLCTGLRIIVEYDGSFWHAKGLERDARKTQDLISKGWLVVRVRQAPLAMVGPWDVAGEAKDPDTFNMTVQVLDRILAAAEAASASHPAHEHLEDLRERVRTYRAEGVAQASNEAQIALTDGRVNRPRPTSSGLPRPLMPGQSLAEKSPETAAEWHPELNNGLTAWNVANGRNSKAWWRCSLCGKDWEANINGRTRVHSVGCPDCARSRSSLPRPGRSLADLHPEIAGEWHPSKNHPQLPADVNPGSKQRVWWQCSLCGSEWETAIHTRMKHKNVGCPTCGWSRRSAKQSVPTPGQSLADLFPEVAAQWHPTKNGDLLPEGVKHHSNTSVWWRCHEGHEWQTGVGNRTRKDHPTGCPDCYKLRRSSPRKIGVLNVSEPGRRTAGEGQLALW